MTNTKSIGEKSILSKFYVKLVNRTDLLKGQDLRDIYGYDNYIETPVIQIESDKLYIITRFDRSCNEGYTPMNFMKQILINQNIPLNPH